MAKILIKNAMGSYNSGLYSIDWSSFGIEKGATKTSVTMVDQYGSTIELSGSGFKYIDGVPTGGTATEIAIRDFEGNLIMSISDASISIKTFVAADDLQAALQILQRGDDRITGTALEDTLLMGLNAGNDKIYGLGGDDYIVGSAGNNLVDGGSGKDTLNYDWADMDKKNVVGGLDLDASKGTATNPWGGKDTFSNIEVFYASYMNDKLKGGSKGEEFDGVGGNDRLTGGKGADLFIFHGGSDKDTITDFGNGADRLQLSGLIKSGMDYYDTFAEVKALMVAKSGDLIIDFGNGDVLTLLDTSKSDLQQSDFLFV